MKRIHLNIFAGLLSMLLLTSCAKELEKTPLDAISSETFWKTDADVQMALTGCYATLYPFSPLGWARPYLDCLSDNAYSQWGSYNWNITAISTGDLNASSAGLSPTIFSTYYKGIATYNNFLANVEKVESLDEVKKNNYIGQVKFLRALLYFDLVNFYGDIILYKESPQSPDDAKVARTPKAEALTFPLQICLMMPFRAWRLREVPWR